MWIGNVAQSGHFTQLVINKKWEKKKAANGNRVAVKNNTWNNNNNSCMLFCNQMGFTLHWNIEFYHDSFFFFAFLFTLSRCNQFFSGFKTTNLSSIICKRVYFFVSFSLYELIKWIKTLISIDRYNSYCCNCSRRHKSSVIHLCIKLHST